MVYICYPHRDQKMSQGQGLQKSLRGHSVSKFRVYQAGHTRSQTKKTESLDILWLSNVIGLCEHEVTLLKNTKTQVLKVIEQKCEVFVDIFLLTKYVLITLNR